MDAQGEANVLPGMEVMACPGLAVPPDVMHHVVHVESSFNPYAIGVVGGRLVRPPRNLGEAVATARMLESRGYNFSLGLAQVNRYNLARYGLGSYEAAFQACPNLQAGSRILAECHSRSGQDWGKSFSCYYSGNFTTGFRAGYVQKVFASMQQGASEPVQTFAGAIPVLGSPRRSRPAPARVSAAMFRTAGAPVPARREPIAPPSAIAPARGEPMQPTPVSAGDGVAVLQPAGQPPRLTPFTGVGNAPTAVAAPALPPAAPRDAAFVF